MVLSRGEIEKVHARSKAADDGPWVSDWSEMAKKTAVKRLVKMLPMSVELADAVAHDDEVVYGDLKDANPKPEREKATISLDQLKVGTPDPAGTVTPPPQPKKKETPPEASPAEAAPVEQAAPETAPAVEPAAG